MFKSIIFIPTVQETVKNTNLLALVNATLVRLIKKTKRKQREKRSNEKSQKKEVKEKKYKFVS